MDVRVSVSVFVGVFIKTLLLSKPRRYGRKEEREGGRRGCGVWLWPLLSIAAPLDVWSVAIRFLPFIKSDSPPYSVTRVSK